ncbi:hypothetical protein [Catenovulum sediminis]|uniref:Uncharacterized protein n=1 Tax=Catenovulum sediminis TaxID=1740262 RepID=A0ABV1RMK3_9ALTE|nr:hypothetical protein [Catenovulum sediminis]
MAEVGVTSGFINSGLQSALHAQGEIVQLGDSKRAVAPSTAQNDNVTLSPQAQLIQKAGEIGRAGQQPVSSESEPEPQASDSVRVSSSIGKAASAVGLTEQEAIKLYQAINDLL